MAARTSLARIIEGLLGEDLPVRIEGYDGTRLGPVDAPSTLIVRSPVALQRVLTAPGELGFARAYVEGHLDVEGDIFSALALRDRLPNVRIDRKQWAEVLRLATAAGGVRALRPLPPPPEEVRLRGRRHSRARDAAAIRHHYDVANDFYRIVLGPSLTYSCAVFDDPAATLEAAQAAKHELVCQKLGLQPGMRLLDVGCGWGGMVLHAAQHHGVRAVGITVSPRQADLAAKRAADTGVADRVEIRLQDYRDVHDGPYDAISSIGMFEHVGLVQLRTYFARLFQLLPDEGRLLNHAIARPAGDRPRFARASFIDRYVFPDGELHEVGSVISGMQAEGFEVRHVESLREHYALTLRRWVANLEANWDEAVRETGIARARIWRLYMAGSALNFDAGRTQIHQTLAVRSGNGKSGLPLRPSFG
jgi:cyclopropane-fatty-acyl-phospholipid synthase